MARSMALRNQMRYKASCAPKKVSALAAKKASIGAVLGNTKLKKK